MRNIIKKFPRIYFKLPKKNDVVIFDSETYEKTKIFDINKILILDARRESINVLILLISLKYIFILKDLTLYQKYLITYIKFINPKFVITFNYNNLFFWSLKKYFKDTKFIIIQSSVINGHAEGNIFYRARNLNLSKQKIDYIFTWGKEIEKIFKDFIDAKYFCCGSLINNKFKNIESSDKKDTIVFISQFKLHDKNKTIPGAKNDLNTFETNVKERKIVLNVILSYCKINNLKLFILSRGSFNNHDEKVLKEEQIYYEKLIGKENFYLIRKQNQNDIYKIINDYNYFAVISSSVGYEALSRAKRVAFLNVHHNISNYLEGEKLKYGYPADLPLKGPFWTNEASKNEIFRVLDFLINSSKEEWSKFKDKYISPAIIYDENNKNFKEKLNSIGLNIL